MTLLRLHQTSQSHASAMPTRRRPRVRPSRRRSCVLVWRSVRNHTLFLLLCVGLSFFIGVSCRAESRSTSLSFPKTAPASPSSHNATRTHSAGPTTSPRRKKRRGSTAPSSSDQRSSRARHRPPEEPRLPSPSSSPRSDTLRRVQREWRDIVASGTAYHWRRGEPIGFRRRQHVFLGPIHSSLLVWHFTLVGLPGSPYAGGLYHGRIVLPSDYPAAPPRVQVWTPSGRFLTMHDICLTASNYHPETWSSQWSIRTIVEALRLHFVTPALEIGGTNEPYDKKVEYARQSHKFTCQVVINAHNVVTIDHDRMIQQGIFADLEEDVTEPAMKDGELLRDSSRTDQEPRPSTKSAHGVQPLTKPGRKRRRRSSARHHPSPTSTPPSRGPPAVRAQPAPSLLAATVQKVLQRPILWLFLFLFCCLQTRRF